MRQKANFIPSLTIWENESWRLYHIPLSFLNIDQRSSFREQIVLGINQTLSLYFHYILMLSSNILSLTVNPRIEFQGLIRLQLKMFISKIYFLCSSWWADLTFYKLYLEDNLLLKKICKVFRSNSSKFYEDASHLFYSNNIQFTRTCLAFRWNSVSHLKGPGFTSCKMLIVKM